MKDKKITPNEKQQAAIDHPYKEPAVVTAAAGSGKTTLLVERVVKLLSDTPSGLNSGSLAIMTFTRNAAKSLREKLNKKLNARFEEENDPDVRGHIKEQIFSLRQAYISTIDAFCLRIIKENPMTFDLPMNFTLADTPKKVTMQLRAIDLAMEDLYDGEHSDLFSEEERRRLFYTFSFKDDEYLKKAVMSAADTLSTFADANKWLNDAEDAYKDINSLEKKYLSAFLPLIKLNHSRAKTVLEGYDGLEDDLDGEVEEYEANGLKGTTKSSFETYTSKVLPDIKNYIRFDTARYEEFCANCEDFEKSPSIGTLCRIFSDFKAHGDPSKIGTGGTAAKMRAVFKKMKDLSEKVSKAILKNDFDEESTLSSLPAQQEVIHSFVKLVRLYIKYYDDVKKNSGCIDFSDCELLLLKKLRDDTEFCSMLSDRFSCIIVDEFQDSNDIQAEIFRLLGKGRLFYVGDIKQSIYAFRGGDPDIMTQLCDGKDGFKPLPLNMNFRSRKAVINVINAAFTGLMTREYGGVDYKIKDNQLEYGADYPDIPEDLKSKFKCEICFINSDGVDEKDMAAPRYIAEKIRAIHDDPNFTIVKNDVLVRPDYSDFAILLRTKTNIDNYRAALRELGIDSTSPAGKDFLDSPEIKLLICCLTIVDNPMRDEEMLKVLMSPIYRLNAEEIGLIRLGLLGLEGAALSDAQKKAYSKKMKSYSLYQCAKICSEDLIIEEFNSICADYPLDTDDKEIKRNKDKKLEAFLGDLNDFRYYKGSSSVYKLVCKICEDTDLASYTAVLDSSTNSVANIRRFRDMAADFEERDGGNLSDFLRFIEYIRSSDGKKTDEAFGAVEDANAVQIMTFHGSKGLEVPICIMSELDNVLSENDMTGTMLMSRELGLAMTDVDIKNRVKRRPLAYRALAKNTRLRLCGEELRLLYVAMTRAREKLIMAVPGKFGSWKSAKLDPDNVDELFDSSQPFKWVFGSLMRYYDEKTNSFGDLECTLFKGDEKAAKAAAPDENESEEESVTPDNIDESGDHNAADPDRVEALSRKIDFRYHHEDDTIRREKYSVTELAHRNSTMFFAPTSPRFAEDAEVSGADKGNAYHKCMQFLPLTELSGVKSADFEKIIADSIKAMTESGQLTEAEAELIDTAHISKFFSEELGQRMLKAKTIRREQPFYAEVDGNDIGEDDLGEITLQGRVDLYFIENDEIVVVDYKSDNKFNLEKEKDNYAQQVKIYSTVLPMLTGYPVKEIFLYAFLEDRAIEINDK